MTSGLSQKNTLLFWVKPCSCFLFLLLYSCADEVSSNKKISTIEINSTQIERFFTLNDTVFLERNTVGRFGKLYHAVYIDTNKNSPYYDRLTNFNTEEYSYYKTDYQSHIEEYSKLDSNFHLKHFQIPNEIKEWNFLHQLDSSLYLYAPSDWGNNRRFQFTDSTYISWNMDGPFPHPIHIFKKISDIKYEFEVLSRYENNSTKKLFFQIHIIDQERGLAILSSSFGGKQYQSLMVKKSHVKNFPIVVNYCKDQKVIEFTDFDKVDITAHIK